MANVNLVDSDTIEIEQTNNDIKMNLVFDAIYPVGSIYMSVNSTNTSTLFGGTWQQWGSGKVPVGIDENDTDFDTVEATGGEKTHTLTIDEIPSHKHLMEYGTNTSASGGRVTVMAGNGPYTSPNIIYNAGGGQAHNNLQPYITCYMWKRTA